MNDESRRELAKEVLRELGPETPAKLYEHNSYPIIILGERKLVFGEQYITYGQKFSAVPYGGFFHGQVDKAMDFLQNPSLPPEAIVEDVEAIVSGLKKAGIKEKDVSIDWKTGIDKPIVKQLTLPQRDVRFGLDSPRSINCFEKNHDKGPTDVGGAIKYLHGSCYNK